MKADLIKYALALLSASLALPAAAACDYPDEGNRPLRRAVARVQLLPEIEAWSRLVQENGGVAQFIVLLEDTVRARGGYCYWTVEVAENGRLWQRYYITPDGKRLVKGKPED